MVKYGLDLTGGRSVPGFDFEQLDHFQILNVARGASINEIKKAFRQEIAIYHPDRFMRASDEEKSYARARSQRINEAFRVLRDDQLRENYNMTMPGGGIGRNSMPVPTGPLTQRDHQGELYETALAHINAGRLIQAVAVLRRLQQLNPFYRDVASLLSNTESAINARQLTMPYESIRRTSWLTVSVIAIVIVTVALVWVFGTFGSPTAPDATVTTVVATETVPFTRTPRITSTPEVVEITPTPDPAVLFEDNFTTVNWAEAQGPTWSTAYDGKRFHLVATQAGDAAWSYRPVAQSDVVMKVLLQVTNGSGGVIVRYRDETDFVAVVIEPESQTYRILRRDGTTFQELSSGTSESLKRGDAIQNELTVTVVGTDITITINGVATDPVTVEGISDSARFGMIAVPTSSDADVYVDHITIRMP
jgi:hypothetical protein